MSIVTLDLAKLHMNVDGTADDEIIQLYLDAAEQWIGNYIGKAVADMDPLPADLKLAILQLVAFRYEQREAVAYGITGQLAPFGVTAVADSYRENWFTDGDANG